MLGIGVVALVLLLGPWAWRSWQESHMTDGETWVFSQKTSRPVQELAMCLMKRGPDGVALDIFSEGHFYNSERELVVFIQPRTDSAIINPKFWVALVAGLPPGKSLTTAEKNRLQSCADS